MTTQLGMFTCAPKRPYDTEIDAAYATAEVHNKALDEGDTDHPSGTPYPCRFCGYWHILAKWGSSVDDMERQLQAAERGDRT